MTLCQLERRLTASDIDLLHRRYLLSWVNLLEVWFQMFSIKHADFFQFMLDTSHLTEGNDGTARLAHLIDPQDKSLLLLLVQFLIGHYLFIY